MSPNTASIEKIGNVHQLHDIIRDMSGNIQYNFY